MCACPSCHPCWALPADKLPTALHMFMEVAGGGHFLEAASEHKQFPLLASCSWLPEVTCWKCQKGHAHLFLNNCEQEHKTHYREVKFITSVHLAHHQVSFHSPHGAREWLSHVPIVFWPRAGCRKERATLSAVCHPVGSPRTVLSGPHLLPATSRLPRLAMELSWPYWHLRHAASPADGQQGFGRWGNGQKATKHLYSHIACPEFPFTLAPAEVGWVRHDVVASTCTAHHTSHHSAPLKLAWNNAGLRSRP